VCKTGKKNQKEMSKPTKEEDDEKWKEKYKDARARIGFRL